MFEVCDDKVNIFKNSNVDCINVENIDILGVFEGISQFINSDVCDLELCELTILQNFRFVEISLPQFLDEVC